MKITLDKFKLAGYYPYNPIKGESMELGLKLQGCTPWIDATVPGSIYKDLMRAKLIKNPYYNMDSLLVEWVPTRWWVYITHFDRPITLDDIYLNILGINYKAHIYVNNHLLGITENMFVPQKFLLNQLTDKNNELKIIIEHAPDEYGQVGYTSKTFTQKSRFDYKWDFGVRMIDMGIWRPIFLSVEPKTQVSDYHIRLNEFDLIQLDVNFNQIGSKILSVVLKDNKKIVCNKESILNQNEKSYSLILEVDQLKKWYPNGFGKQPLYHLELTVNENGKIYTLIDQKVGFKQARFSHNENFKGDSLPFTLNVNNQKVYIKGINMVPLDMMLGVIDKKRYKKLLLQLKELNINLVRVWGGGIIEKEEFYKLCDELGIMVWQDFIQSSSGIDNYPSHLPEFLDNMKRTAHYATKTRRNYVSLVAFCGGNELMYPDWSSVNLKVDNINRLDKIVKENCPEITFFPTSPAGVTFGPMKDQQELNTDIHGEWRYLGVKEHYHYFNTLKNLLHSEFGVDGMTDYKTIKKTLPKSLHVVEDFNDNMYLRHRGDWWNTFQRDTSIFGMIDSIETQSVLSQFLQAEGLRYAVDANRRHAPYQSGCIVWQANEPFPNLSCTSLINYYGTPKLAYYVLKKSYQDLVFSYKYDTLIYQPNELISIDLFVASDFDTTTTAHATLYLDDQVFIEKEIQFTNQGFHSSKLTTFEFKVTSDFHTIRLETKAINHQGKLISNSALLFIQQENHEKQIQAVYNFRDMILKEGQ